jgi:hypothetical protein
MRQKEIRKETWQLNRSEEMLSITAALEEKSELIYYLVANSKNFFWNFM